MNKYVKYGIAETRLKAIERLHNEPVLYNLFWEATLRCNEKCKHCGSRAGEKVNYPEELTTEEIKNTFKSIAEKTDATKIAINVTGGEPLLREDLFDVMSYAKELGFMWGITTNGLLLDKESVLENFKKAGVNTIAVSIDGLENSHDGFRGVKGAFRKTIDNLKLLRDSNAAKFIMVSTCFNKNNINELEDVYKILKELKVDIWQIIPTDPLGRAKDSDVLPSLDDYKKAFEFIKEKRKKETDMVITAACSHYKTMKYEIDIRNQFFMCMSGITTASILYNGDIYVCPSVERRKELVQGNVREDNFIDVWNNKFKLFRDMNKFKKGKCNQCSEWKYCRGDSTCTWDFDNDEPLICLKNL